MKTQNTTDKEFQIPDHWIRAAKITKLFAQAFYNIIGEETFRSWDFHQRFDRNFYKDKIYVSLRHTLNWGAYYEQRDNDWGYIGVNLDDDTIGTNSGLFNGLKNVLCSTISHELIHHFQNKFGLENSLPIEERRHLNLSSSKFNTNKNSFLYATNWKEMDAEVGSYYCTYKHIPSRKELVQNFSEWYRDNALGHVIGDYIYDYVVLGNKRLEYRQRVWNGLETESGLFSRKTA